MKFVIVQVIMVTSYSLEVYLQVLVVNMALNQTWIALLIFVLCAFPSVAFRLSPVITAITGFASGFFIPRDSMPPWWAVTVLLKLLHFGAVDSQNVMVFPVDRLTSANRLAYVTRSDKKGLIAHDRKCNFFTQIQSYMNALLDFSVRHGLW